MSNNQRGATLGGRKPMLLDNRKQLPFNDPAWVFELKNDGYRMLAEFGAEEVHLRTRGGNDCGGWFPEVAQALARFKGGPYIVDGEVCVMDDIGRSDFDRLERKARLRKLFTPRPQEDAAGGGGDP